MKKLRSLQTESDTCWENILTKLHLYRRQTNCKIIGYGLVHWIYVVRIASVPLTKFVLMKLHRSCVCRSLHKVLSRHFLGLTHQHSMHINASLLNLNFKTDQMETSGEKMSVEFPLPYSLGTCRKSWDLPAGTKHFMEHGRVHDWFIFCRYRFRCLL